jgi:hypothetical protein
MCVNAKRRADIAVTEKRLYNGRGVLENLNEKRCDVMSEVMDAHCRRKSCRRQDLAEPPQVCLLVQKPADSVTEYQVFPLPLPTSGPPLFFLTHLMLFQSVHHEPRKNEVAFARCCFRISFKVPVTPYSVDVMADIQASWWMSWILLFESPSFSFSE